MKRVSIIGHFGFGFKYLDGQTIKTKIVSDELQRQLGQDQVQRIDTHGGWKSLLKAPFQVFHALNKSSNVLIFPAHNGLRVYAPLLAFLKRFFKGRKIHYVVIGGWLPQFIQNRPFLVKSLKKYDGIYVETNTMKNALQRQGFKNIFVMPNCKKLDILSVDELVYQISEPYKLCTFSRVMKEKGIEDAVDAVKAINVAAGRTVYMLDIYGPVDSDQAKWFEQLQVGFPDYVKYKGVVDSNQSVDVLKNYFALLFPTRFYTEGIPGTVIDAYAAGIPVISSRWESFSDVIDQDITGFGYTFGSQSELINLLFSIAENPQIVLELKSACLEKAKEFTPETVVNILTRGGGIKISLLLSKI